MKKIIKNAIILLTFIWPVFSISQVIVTPKISATHNHYYWNIESQTGIENPQEWTWGVGAVARLPLHKKLYGLLSFSIYPFGLKYVDESFGADVPNFIETTSTDIFDVKLGLDYKLYPKTLLGVGIEMEQYFNSKLTTSLSTVRDRNFLNQKYFGAEISLTQWIGKVEISADVFIGLHEGGIGSSFRPSDGTLLFYNHKKLQIGIGIPIDLK
jgi:hypothetical protein